MGDPGQSGELPRAANAAQEDGQAREGRGDVQVGYRFRNDTSSVAGSTAYASGNGLDYEPVGQLHPVLPFEEQEPPAQFPPSHDPRYARVDIDYNGLLYGPFIVGPTASDLLYIEAILRFAPHDPAQLEVIMQLSDEQKAYEAASFPINPQIPME